MSQLWSSLVQVFIPNAIQLSCFSLLAWICLKEKGALPFELAGCASIGVLAITKLNNLGMPVGVSSALGAFIALAAHSVFQRAPVPLALKKEIFGMLFALIVLVVFEFFTDAALVSVRYPGISLLGTTVLVAFGIAVLVHRMLVGSYGPHLRLGMPYAWAARAWLGDATPPPRFMLVILLLAWWVTLAVPVCTTGVASHTVFRDTTLAVLVAKAVGVRHLINLPLIASFASAMRLAVAFTWAGPFGSVAGDCAVLALLALIIAMRSKVRSDSYHGRA